LFDADVASWLHRYREAAGGRPVPPFPLEFCSKIFPLQALASQVAPSRGLYCAWALRFRSHLLALCFSAMQSRRWLPRSPTARSSWRPGSHPATLCPFVHAISFLRLRAAGLGFLRPPISLLEYLSKLWWMM
jgi:hypothetical protein